MSKQPDLEELETQYGMCFMASNHDLCEFTMTSWNLSAIFFSSISDKTSENLTPKQRVCIFMIAKAQRLLRAIYKLILSGNLPEAEILIRTLYEAQTLLFYILEDDSDKRANKWLSFDENQKWPSAEIHEVFKDNDIKTRMKEFYSKLCLYPHNHRLSMDKFVRLNVDNQTFSVNSGPATSGFENDGELLKYAAMINASMCEIARNHFDLTSDFEDAYKELTKTKFYEQSMGQTVATLKKNPKQAEGLGELIDSSRPSKDLHK